MRIHYSVLGLILFIAGQLGAQTDSAAIKPITPKLTVTQYIEKYSAIAVDEMYRSKIPASITLAQGILESGNGNSRLATEANNHFGIKCKASWTGEKVYEDDDAPQECFRKYPAAIDSYRDHSDFLMKNSRYAFLFDLDPSDYKGWAHGLKKAGYATNPQYAELLITFIEKHKLNRFDATKISEEEDRELKEEKALQLLAHGKEIEVNGVPGIVAKAGDSYASIAMTYDLKVHQLYRYNDLSKDAICQPGDTLYLKSKKNKNDIAIHLVVGTETMYLISQRYAIKLEKLLDRNKMLAGEEPEIGEQVFLKDSRNEKPKLRALVPVSKPDSVQQPEIKPEPVVAKPETQVVSAPKDSAANLVVYEDPKRNLETLPVVETPVNRIDSLHDFRENLSFFHTVQQGETLYGISRKYGVRVDAVKYLNLLESDSIGVGQRLIINPAIKSADTREPQRIPGVHVVREGETIYSISKMYNLKPADILATNNLVDNKISIGQHLVIVPGQAPNKPESFIYTYSAGETWFSISRKFGLTIEELRKLNPKAPEVLQGKGSLKIR